MYIYTYMSVSLYTWWVSIRLFRLGFFGYIYLHIHIFIYTHIHIHILMYTHIYINSFICIHCYIYKYPRFSFDSSAWLFLWHFGVAMWIEDNMDKNPSALGYSGSSGGALVAGALASGINSGRHVYRRMFMYIHICLYVYLDMIV